jgi:alkylation response protein AidB-like acyl-CoA dehydrogenase
MKWILALFIGLILVPEGISAREIHVSKTGRDSASGSSGQPYLTITKAASVAKLFASEASMDITKDAVQIFGAYGYSQEYPLERFFRDAKITEIGDGTSEIQRIIIADELLKGKH